MKKQTLHIRHETPFVMVDYMALMSKTLTAYEIAVYCILCAYASSTDQSCYPSYQTIARKSGCSRRTAIRVIAHLEELGLVKKQEQFNAVGDNTSNLYIVKPKILEDNQRVIENQSRSKDARVYHAEQATQDLSYQLQEYQEFVDSIPEKLRDELLLKYRAMQQQQEQNYTL